MAVEQGTEIKTNKLLIHPTMVRIIVNKRVGLLSAVVFVKKYLVVFVFFGSEFQAAMANKHCTQWQNT